MPRRTIHLRRRGLYRLEQMISGLGGVLVRHVVEG